MKNTFFLFGCLVISAITSCVNKGVSELAVLELKMSSLEKNISDLELNKIGMALDGYNYNLDLIKKCLDTLENDYVLKINQYKGIKKACPAFSNNYSITTRNIYTELEQLNFLKADLDAQLIEEDSINYFLDLENRNILKIADDVNVLLELYSLINHLHDSLHEPIKVMVQNYCGRK